MTDLDLVVTGAIAGLGVGYLFQRADLCFHSAWRGLLEHRYHLFKVWILGVALASVGLALVYASDRWALNEGLAFRPRGNIVGGLVIGIGMVVAASCTSGLFYKVGSGMAGAAVGIGSWFVGDVVAFDHLIGRGDSLDLRGRTAAIEGGPTIPGVLGVSRLGLAVVFLAVTAVLLARARRNTASAGQLAWWPAGIALGGVTTLAWILAGIGGHDFGPSTVGAPASLVSGVAANQWLVAFLVAVVAGSAAAAVRTRSFHLRGERPTRYAQLAAGGFLLGAGGQIGGGCNLGHGLSGAAQLNVSSWVVVGSIVAGIGLARAVQRGAGLRSPAHWKLRPV